MGINTEAIRGTIDELKRRIEKDTQLVNSLEELLPQFVDAPLSRAAADPPKRRGGRRKKVEVATPAPSTRKTRTSKADPVNGQDGAKRTFNITCKTCDANYIGAGPRSPCPKCNPTTVTSQQWAGRQRSEKPRGADRSA